MTIFATLCLGCCFANCPQSEKTTKQIPKEELETAFKNLEEAQKEFVSLFKQIMESVSLKTPHLDFLQLKVSSHNFEYRATEARRLVHHIAAVHRGSPFQKKYRDLINSTYDEIAASGLGAFAQLSKSSDEEGSDNEEEYPRCKHQFKLSKRIYDTVSSNLDMIQNLRVRPKSSPPTDS